MTEQELRQSIDIQDGTSKPSMIQGVEIMLDWENPDCLIAPHVWIDPKLRGHGIGKVVISEVEKAANQVDRIEDLYIDIQDPDGVSSSFLQDSGFETKTYTHDEWGEMVEGHKEI